jgi:hypothetical protein
MECPKCGSVLTRNGYNRHQSSRACEAVIVERELREGGWVRSGDRTATLRRLKMPLRRELAFVRDGRRRRVRMAHFTPNEVLVVYRSRGETELVHAFAEGGLKAVRQLAALALLSHE